MANSTQKLSTGAHYFARGAGSSFNITNVIEDTIESVFGFALRFVSTTSLLLWKPKAVVFHIMTHNRQLRITRPYSYFLASVLLFMACFTLSLAFGAKMARLFDKYYGAGFSIQEFVQNPRIETALLALAPTLLGVLIAVWISAILAAVILIPWRRLRPLLMPTYFGLLYILSLNFLTMAVAAASEAVASEVFSVRGGYWLGGDTSYLLPLAVFLVLSLLVAVVAIRLLLAFARVGYGRRARKWAQAGRVLAAWCVATAGLYLAVAIAGGIPASVNDLSAKLDRQTVEKPEPKYACRSAQWVPSEYQGGGEAPLFTLSRARKLLPFLGNEFEFLLVNEGEVELDLVSTVKLWGGFATCKDLQAVSSCKTNKIGGLGTAQIIEPRPIGGLVIVPPGSSVGIRLKVSDLSYSGESTLVSAPALELKSQRFDSLRDPPETDCDPFAAYRENFLANR